MAALGGRALEAVPQCVAAKHLYLNLYILITLVKRRKTLEG